LPSRGGNARTGDTIAHDAEFLKDKADQLLEFRRCASGIRSAEPPLHDEASLAHAGMRGPRVADAHQRAVIEAADQASEVRPAPGWRGGY